MQDQSIIRHYLRLNLQNEQHKRVQAVLENLNKSIHKSENQFIINAVDHYIRSFEDDAVIGETQQKDKPEYVTVGELEQIRKEIESGMKDELIRLLGVALMGSPMPRVGADRQGSGTEEGDPYAAEAANRWG